MGCTESEDRRQTKGLERSGGKEISVTGLAPYQAKTRPSFLMGVSSRNPASLRIRQRILRGGVCLEFPVLSSPFAPCLLCIVLLAASCGSSPGGNPIANPATPSIEPHPQKSYGTNFPLTENPISEQGNWINGGTVGLDWGNVQTSPGLAFGTVVSGGPPYNDSTAVLAGTWAPNQMAQATVRTVNQNSTIFEEVQIRLRTTVTSHSITGYEFYFQCTADGSRHAQIVRWNGPLNNFTLLDDATGPGLHNGDLIAATAVGDTLTSYVNGVPIIQAKDSTYSSGSPGIGFYNQRGTLANNSDFGLTKFSAAEIAGPGPGMLQPKTPPK